jgi:hypothetical protein
MNLIGQALDRLRLDLEECRGAVAYRPLDVQLHLRNLVRTVEDLEKKYDTGVAPKPPLDPETVWAKWHEEQYDLDKLDNRERRTLCVSPQTAMRPRLVQGLANSPDSLRRLTTLIGFVSAYFTAWRVMEDPEAVEALIRTMLGKISRKSRVIEAWRSAPFVFSADAAQLLAEAIVRDKKVVKQLCDELYINPSTPLAAATQRYATIAAVKKLISKQSYISEPEAAEELRWVTHHLMGKDLDPPTFRSAMADLIVSKLPDNRPVFQKSLVEAIHSDDRLGDPRLASNAPGWRTMSQEAKERFLAWLAKETLQFFFDTLVPTNDENRKRAKFWLDYAKKQGKVKDFQVAVSDEDVHKIKASRAKTIPSHSRVTGGKTSAFLMVFEGYGTEYVIIEFSETGNAAYIYKREAFESAGTKLRSSSFHLTDVLKRRGAEEDRIIHIGEWEPKARRTLSELGIRP